MMVQATASTPATGLLLRDIHLPPNPSWWPLAPGWWGVALVLLAVVAFLLWRWRMHRQRRVLERRMLQEVDVLLAQWHDEPQKLASGLHQLLRRGALRYDVGAAHHHGEDWRRTLAIIPVDAPTLDQLMVLEEAMYRPAVSFDTDITLAAVRRWLVLAWRHRAKGNMTMPASAGRVGGIGHA